MSSNTNLNLAQLRKNDEYFTNFVDIEKEMSHYDFQNKTVYCNCSNFTISSFYSYFRSNFNSLNLKRLICTGLNCDGIDFDGTSEVTIPPSNVGFADGAYRRFLNEADIVVENPPFSKLGEYIPFLLTAGKDFIVVGTLNCLTYKSVFPFLKHGKIRCGVEQIAYFLDVKRNATKRLGNTIWLTTLNHGVQPKPIALTATYYEAKYPRFVNADGINVDRATDIPRDYCGVMGVPVSFIPKINAEQFEIVGLTSNHIVEIDGVRRRVYKRVLVRRK